MNPNLIIAALVLAIVLAGGGYWKGWSDRAARCEALAAQASSQSGKQAIIELKAANEAGEMLETENVKERIVYRTITQQVDRIVERPVYRDGACLDADGLRIVNAATAGKAADPGQPDSPVPGPAPAP